MGRMKRLIEFLPDRLEVYLGRKLGRNGYRPQKKEIYELEHVDESVAGVLKLTYRRIETKDLILKEELEMKRK